MVVMFLPATSETGVEQERTAAPSTCTVQAPHSPAPQPNLVPVKFNESRKTQSSGVSGGRLTLRSLPFTRRDIFATVNPVVRQVNHGTQNLEKGEMVGNARWLPSRQFDIPQIEETLPIFDRKYAAPGCLGTSSGLDERFPGNIYLVHYPQALPFESWRSYLSSGPSSLTQIPALLLH